MKNGKHFSALMGQEEKLCGVTENWKNKKCVEKLVNFIANEEMRGTLSLENKIKTDEEL